MQEVAGDKQTSPRRYNKLNDKQLYIFNLLYRFRFGTGDLLAQSLGINKRVMNKRLQRLFDQGYLDRRYDASYKLTHRPAVYLLSKEGRRTLLILSKTYKPEVMSRLARDRKRSESHVNHWLAVLQAYTRLNAQYGKRLNFFTANQLGAYDYFPQPLPDAFIRLKAGDKKQEQLFYLYLLNGSNTDYEATKTVFNLIKFAEEDVWTWEDKMHHPMPRILLVCDTAQLQKRLARKLRRAVYGVDAEQFSAYTTTLAELEQGNAWQDLLDMDEVLPLHGIYKSTFS